MAVSTNVRPRTLDAWRSQPHPFAGYLNTLLTVWPVALAVFLATGAAEVTLTPAPPESAETNYTCDGAKFKEIGGALLLYSTADKKQPLTRDALAEACVGENSTLEWISEYSRHCIKGVAGGVMRVLLDGAESELQSRCYGERQQNYLKHAKCLNDQARELSGCNTDMTLMLESVVERNQRERMLAHSCCAIQAYERCMEQRASSKCGDEAGAFTKQIVHRIGEELISGPCGKFTEESEECQELAQMSINDTSREPHYPSFVPVMVDLLEHYG